MDLSFCLSVPVVFFHYQKGQTYAGAIHLWSSLKYLPTDQVDVSLLWAVCICLCT